MRADLVAAVKKGGVAAVTKGGAGEVHRDKRGRASEGRERGCSRAIHRERGRPRGSGEEKARGVSDTPSSCSCPKAQHTHILLPCDCVGGGDGERREKQRGVAGSGEQRVQRKTARINIVRCQTKNKFFTECLHVAPDKCAIEWRSFREKH
jgi:hypothetical protein